MKKFMGRVPLAIFLSRSSPLYGPETNVVCFIARPMFFLQKTLKPRDCSITELNRINRCIYGKLSIVNEPEQRLTSYAQPFFVSRTTLVHEQYSGRGIERLLQELGIERDQYAREGLFVLRCTVMNPLHYTAYRQGKIDYLYEFVKHLHSLTSTILSQMGSDRVAP